jgi:hypothetical protein
MRFSAECVDVNQVLLVNVHSWCLMIGVLFVRFVNACCAFGGKSPANATSCTSLIAQHMAWLRESKNECKKTQNEKASRLLSHVAFSAVADHPHQAFAIVLHVCVGATGGFSSLKETHLLVEFVQATAWFNFIVHSFQLHASAKPTLLLGWLAFSVCA